MEDAVSVSIALPTDQAVYKAGQPVTGVVIVGLTRHTAIRGIRIELKGTATVNYPLVTDERSRYRGTRRIVKTEKFLRIEKEILVRDEFDAGCHDFPFSFSLGKDLPSTYDDTIGGIQYSLEASVDAPLSPGPTHKNFHVIAQEDLNALPSAGTPMCAQDAAVCNCLCLCSINVSATFRTDRTAYVPGEVIRWNAQVDNDSGDVRYCKVIFIKTIVYIVDLRRTHRHILAERDLGEVTAHGSRTWQDEWIPVPDTPATGMRGCAIMDVTYKLKFSVGSTDSMFNVNLPLEVFIGTVPLAGPGVPTAPTPTAPPGASPEKGKEGPEAPPPTYEEAVATYTPGELNPAAPPSPVHVSVPDSPEIDTPGELNPSAPPGPI